jgi:hypothetical protein
MFPFFGLDTVTILTTIFWLWMLIDCVFSKKKGGGGGIKVGWLIFILLTHIVGAVIYFFAECSHQNPVDAFAYYYQYIKRAFQSEAQAGSGRSGQSYQPQPAAASPQSYSDYQQGYQVQSQQPVPVSTSIDQDVAVDPYQPQPQYEQPMVSYPEMPQQ